MQGYFRAVLFVHAAYCLLCIAWNAYGLWQIEQGMVSIGPTASIPAIAIIGALLCVLIFSYLSSKPGIYLAAALVIFVLALLTVWGGFSKPATLWASEFWRYAGIVLNASGVLAFLATLRSFFAYRVALHDSTVRG